MLLIVDFFSSILMDWLSALCSSLIPPDIPRAPSMALPVFRPLDIGIRVSPARGGWASCPGTACVGLAGVDVTAVMVMLLITLLGVVLTVALWRGERKTVPVDNIISLLHSVAMPTGLTTTLGPVVLLWPSEGPLLNWEPCRWM